MALITIPSDSTLYATRNLAATTLNASIDNSQTTVPVAAPSKFAGTGGFAVMEEGVDSEMIKYAGVSGSDLTGVTRDYDGLGAFSFTGAATIEEKVFAEHHNALKDGLISLATAMRSLQQGTTEFAELSLDQASTGSGSIDTGATLEADDTTGTVRFRFDSYEEQRSFEIGPEATTFLAMTRFLGDHSAIDVATNRLRIYAASEIDNASQLWCDINPAVGSSASAVAYDFRSKYDLVDPGAYNLRVQNQGTTLFGVSKTQVDGNRFNVIGAGSHFSLTPLGSDPVSPSDGEVWFTTIGGTTQLKIRVAGVTKAVTLS